MCSLNCGSYTPPLPKRVIAPLQLSALMIYWERKYCGNDERQAVGARDSPDVGRHTGHRASHIYAAPVPHHDAANPGHVQLAPARGPSTDDAGTVE